MSEISDSGIINGIAGLMASLFALSEYMVWMSGASGNFMDFKAQMIAFSIAVNLLANVVKMFASISWDEMFRGVASLYAICFALTKSIALLNASWKSMYGFIGVLGTFSVAVGILAYIAKQLSSFQWEELARAGAGLLGLCILLIGSAEIMAIGDRSINKFAGEMLLFSSALVILSGATKILASMEWEQLGKAAAGFQEL